jgi:DNA-binding transcriptional LysR family regulator
MDRLQCMNIFVQVADRGNFSKVAREQGLSTSVVSKYVAALEDQLGVRLLNRTTRSLSVTEIGVEYLQRCRQILDHVEDAHQAATSLQIEPRGLLRINAPMSFGILHLGKLIAGFTKRYPDVEIDLELNDRFVDVVHEGFDIALRIGILKDSALIGRKLAPVHRVCCGSPEYLKQHGTPEHPQDLSTHKGLFYGHRGWTEDWIFYGKDGEFRSEAKVLMKSNNGDILKAAAVAGAGLVTMPTFITWDEVQSGTLVPMMLNYPAKEMGLYAVYPPTHNLSAKVRVFIDFLVEVFGSEPYWDKPFGIKSIQ